jgi:hypothetical protein
MTNPLDGTASTILGVESGDAPIEGVNVLLVLPEQETSNHVAMVRAKRVLVCCIITSHDVDQTG